MWALGRSKWKQWCLSISATIMPILKWRDQCGDKDLPADWHMEDMTMATTGLTLDDAKKVLKELRKQRKQEAGAASSGRPATARSRRGRQEDAEQPGRQPVGPDGAKGARSRMRKSIGAPPADGRTQVEGVTRIFGVPGEENAAFMMALETPPSSSCSRATNRAQRSGPRFRAAWRAIRASASARWGPARRIW